MPKQNTQTQDSAHTTPDVPREDLRELINAGLDAVDAGADPMQIELREIAEPILSRMRERWMDAFTAEMCAELEARRADRAA